MFNTPLMGFIAALLIILILLLAMDLNQRHHRTVGDKIDDAVQELRD